jgi:hypothetical protein
MRVAAGSSSCNSSRRFAVELSAKHDDPGDVAAGMRRGLVPEHPVRQSRRSARVCQGMHRLRVDYASGDNDIGMCCDQLNGGGFAPLRIFSGHTTFDNEIASLDPAESQHRFVEPMVREQVAGNDETDMALLRASCAQARQPTTAVAAALSRISRRLTQSPHRRGQGSMAGQ